MLYYDGIYMREGIDPTKINISKECIICYHWFFHHGFMFQDFVCTGCHDLTTLCLHISGIAIITVKNIDYHCIIYNIRKSKAINVLKNYVLEDRGYI